jgi:hypothetical protein
MIEIDISIGSEAMWAIGIAQATITTLATMIAIGVAFLVKPGRPTLYWSCAFTLAMVSTFGVIAGGYNDAEIVRRISLGLLLGAPALLWSGFRALWGERAYVWAGPALSVLSATALVVAGDSGWFAPAYRLAYVFAAAFAILLFVDWLRFGDRRDRLVLPLAIVSVAFGISAAVSGVMGLIAAPAGTDELGTLRVTSSIGMLIYVTCAVVATVGTTLRGVTRRSSTYSTVWEEFHDLAADRLLRGQRAGEAWSMVSLRMDDLAELRQAAGPAALGVASDRFAVVVRSVFPSDSTVASPDTGTLFVLVPRPDTVVRDLLRTCLERVARLDVPGRLPVHLSASVGWASTSTVGYDANALIYLSREATVLADQNGGDRWERVNATVVERLLHPQAPR